MRALAFSAGKDSMACLHLMRDTLDCAIHADTGFEYPETKALVDYAATILPMHVIKVDRTKEIPSDVVPIDWTELGQLLSGKKAVTIQSYLECCLANVSLPIFLKAKELGVTELVSGERKQESHKSASLDGQVVQGVKRLHPIYNWTDEEVIRYLESKMEVPKHYSIKHSSLDCYDCTAYRKESADRISYTQENHPAFFKVYKKRADALAEALRAA